MTKKHFIALADAIRESQPAKDKAEGESVTQDVSRGQWSRDVLAIADVCQASNPRFDRERWLGYIAGTNGKNGGKVK